MAVVDEGDLYCFSTLIPCVNISRISDVDRPGIPEETECCHKYTNPYYALAIVNSQLMNWYYQTNLSDDLSVVPGHIQQLPIAEISPGLSESERAKKVEEAKELLNDYLEHGTCNPTEDIISNQLSERNEGVIHDFLVHLAEELSEANRKRLELNLDLLEYLGDFDTPQELTDIGVYHFPASAGETLLDETTKTREKLRVGRAVVRREDSGVDIYLTGRYKPNNGTTAETDRWGYTESEPIPAISIPDLSELEIALVEAFVPIAVDEGGGFAGFRETATKTKSLRDRLHELELPDIEEIRADFEDYLEDKQQADQLDSRINKLDSLTDEAVYHLYGLNEERIRIIEDSANIED